MAIPQIKKLPTTQLPADPLLKDVLNQFKKDIFLSLNCHHIGTIQSFDPEDQTATVTINYKKTFSQRKPGGVYVQQLRDYPPLIDCPVIVLGGGPTSLTFPIQEGDECIVLFNDRDLDTWFSGDSNSGNATVRQHSLADAVVLVGLRSVNSSLEEYDEDRAVLQNGSTKVAIGPSLIEISNQLYTLNELLQELVTDVNNLVSQTAAITVTAVTPGLGVSGPPLNAAAITAVGAQLSATAAKIGQLLE